ncbi:MULTISPECIES: hypothetical protein [unclassified Rhizobium]|uniref:hypothetical protein n=1 Tax=unclassified Rhizobium TaxID=2613769 RepID=UPI0025D40871|nr:hypothetical protein [Rhizobium sp. UBA1881]
MTVTTSLVSEIVRAANRLPSLQHEERRHLLQRGVATSAALRGLLAKTGKISPMDESTERVVEDIARNIGEMSEDTVRKALLALAGQIRELRILNREPA